jgi:hypothetical protein
MFHFYASYQPVRKMSGNRFAAVGQPVFGHGTVRGPAEARHLLRELWKQTYPGLARLGLQDCPERFSNFCWLGSTTSMEDVHEQLQGHAAPVWFKPGQSVCITPPQPAQPVLPKVILRKKIGGDTELQILVNGKPVGISLVQHVKIEMGTDEIPYVTVKFLADVDIELEDAHVATEATEATMISNIQAALASLPFTVVERAVEEAGKHDIFGRKTLQQQFL